MSRRIAFVSTYPPTPCGIGRYTASLIGALKTKKPGTLLEVIAETEGGALSEIEGVRRSWSRRGNWEKDILRETGRGKFDILHIQYEEAIFGQDARLIRLLSALRQDRVKTVITLHTVYEGFSGWVPGRWLPRRFYRALAENCDLLIVHQDRGMKDRLIGQGVPPSKIVVIPHGSTPLDLPEKIGARQRLNLEVDSKIVLFFGFIHQKKGVHTLVRAFDGLVREIPTARLLIAGLPRRRHVLDSLYFSWLKWIMRPGIRKGFIDFHPFYVPDEEMPYYFAAADLIALPHHQFYGSASGVLHAAMGAGRPFVCSRGPKFDEAIQRWAADVPQPFPPPGNSSKWRGALTDILRDDNLRRQIAQISKDFGARTSWSQVAERHLRIYEGL